MWRMGGAESTEHEQRKVGGGGGGGVVERSLQCQQARVARLQGFYDGIFIKEVSFFYPLIINVSDKALRVFA